MGFAAFRSFAGGFNPCLRLFSIALLELAVGAGYLLLGDVVPQPVCGDEYCYSGDGAKVAGGDYGGAGGEKVLGSDLGVVHWCM